MTERDIEGWQKTNAKYWRKLIAEQEASGQKARPFCRERGIGECSFYYWRNRLRKMPRCNLRCSKPCRRLRPPASALELVLRNGERLRIGDKVEAATLRMVLEVVRG